MDGRPGARSHAWSLATSRSRSFAAALAPTLPRSARLEGWPAPDLTGWLIIGWLAEETSEGIGFYVTSAVLSWTDAYDAVFETAFDVNLNPDAPNDLEGSNFKASPLTVLFTPPADLRCPRTAPVAQRWRDG